MSLLLLGCGGAVAAGSVSGVLLGDGGVARDGAGGGSGECLCGCVWGGGLDCSSPRWPSMLTLCFLFCCFWFLSPPAFLGIWMMMAALPRSCGCALVILDGKCRCCRDPLAVAAASERARERPWGGGCGGCLFCCLVVGGCGGGWVGLWGAPRGWRGCEGMGLEGVGGECLCACVGGGGLDCSSPRWPSMLTLCFFSLLLLFLVLVAPAFLGIWMMMAALPRSCGCALVI